jgi:hypothetical protein
MGAIEIDILNINIETKVCVVTITDDNVEIITSQNIGLELNPDGTANTAWIIDNAKRIVLNRRKIKAEQTSIDKITSTIKSEE